MSHFIFLDISVVVIASAFIAWISLYIKQPIVVGYILAGILMGPWGFKVIHDIDFITNTSNIGVTLLLFLAGLTLEPKRIPTLLKKTFFLTVVTSGIFGITFYFILMLFSFSTIESILLSVSFIFSSTILVLKLLPTIALHQKHMGALAIAVLLVQDIIAVIALIYIKSGANNNILDISLIFVYGLILIVISVLMERFLVRFIIKKIQYYQELLYLFTLAWCFAFALVAEQIGLGHEIGAFVAGLSLARNPVSPVLFEGLRFFRDFFLVMFFFSLGALLDFSVISIIILPVLVIAAVILILKPVVFYAGFKISGEKKEMSREMGFRLAQASEFSLILAFTSFNSSLIGKFAFQTVQFATIITMIISSYIVVVFFPTPLAADIHLKQD